MDISRNEIPVIKTFKKKGYDTFILYLKRKPNGLNEIIGGKDVQYPDWITPSQGNALYKLFRTGSGSEIPYIIFDQKIRVEVSNIKKGIMIRTEIDNPTSEDILQGEYIRFHIMGIKGGLYDSETFTQD